MIKRPLNERFNDAVLDGRKITTIRDKDWPIGVPIMLYNWTGKPYRSKQRDVAPIIVLETFRVWIHHNKDGGVYYSRGQLWETEGFDSPEDMAKWFRSVVPRGEHVPKRLMRFSLLNTEVRDVPKGAHE